MDFKLSSLQKWFICNIPNLTGCYELQSCFPRMSSLLSFKPGLYIHSITVIKLKYSKWTNCPLRQRIEEITDPVT